MKVLIWNPLWGAQNNVDFFYNCFVKHLNKQARILSNDNDVTVIVPDWFDDSSYEKHNNVEYVKVGVEVANAIGAFEKDITKELYPEGGRELIEKIKNELKVYLPLSCDVILLWENPVPFLNEIYPDSLIINQMPGFFSRPPYPHTVCFEPYGLYKNSYIYNYPEDVIKQAKESNFCVKKFKDKLKGEIRLVNPLDADDIEYNGKKLALLPLQTSDHYSFFKDYGDKGQLSLFIDTLNKKGKDENLLVTQYISPHATDKVVTESLVAGMKKSWDGIIYNKKFDTIPSVSQYLLQYVDKVYCFSSSLAVQAYAWDLEVSVHENSYLFPINNALKTAEDKDLFLSFVLNNYQPLASHVTEDSIFLNSLLKEMVLLKKQNKKLIVNFSDIDKDYEKSLIESFRGDSSLNNLGKKDLITEARNKDYFKFKRAISSDDCKVVSFDVFDTLLERTVEAPADVYNFLESFLVEKYGDMYDGFSKIRLNSELLARKNCTEGEITIDDIYKHIKNSYQISDDETENIKNEEILIEGKMLRPRPLGKRIWEIAKQLDKEIIIISDMYHLHETVEMFLNKNGFYEYEKLFVSSSYNARKKTGDLYGIVIDYLLGKEIIKGKEEILHIGDNKEADIDQSEKNGIKAMRTPRSIDRMRQNQSFRKIYPPRIGSGEKARSIIAGLTSSNLFDQSSGVLESKTLFSGSVERLGYAAIGPFIYGFAKWLNYQVKKDGCDQVFFLSREGWLLKEAYDIVSKNDKEAPPSKYLLASRRSTRVAALKSKKDIFSIASQPYTEGVVLSDLLESRFGLDSQTLPDLALENTGFKSYDVKLKSDLDTKSKFGDLCGNLQKEILAKASLERLPYLNYLSSIGLAKCIKPAIVDIGWKANMQGALGKLMHRPLHGYYYASLNGVDKWLVNGHTVNSYSGSFVTQNNTDTLVNNRHIVESLICCSDRSFVRMEQVGASFYPVFKNENGYLTRKDLIDKIHSNALKFVEEANKEFKGLSNFLIPDPSLANACLSYFLLSPSAQDVSILKDLVFEDSFGGVTSKVIVSEKASLDSVWKVGSEALESSKNSSKKKPVAGNKPTSRTDKKVSHGLIKKLIIDKVEPYLIKKLSSERQYNKYLRSRELFFKDSRSLKAKKWFDFIGE